MMLDPSLTWSDRHIVGNWCTNFSAAIAIIICGTAMAGVGTEKPELLSRLIITVVLGEALAIYGLLIAFMLISNCRTSTTVEAGAKDLSQA